MDDGEVVMLLCDVLRLGGRWWWWWWWGGGGGGGRQRIECLF